MTLATFYRNPIFAALLGMSLIVGCVTDDGVVGTGPVVLNKEQKRLFDHWSDERVMPDPYFFFLTNGGGTYYVYCPDDTDPCSYGRVAQWKKKCDDKFGSNACRLYASFGRVVWKSDQPADPTWTNGNVRTAKRTVTETVERKISGSWDNDLIVGSSLPIRATPPTISAF